MIADLAEIVKTMHPRLCHVQGHAAQDCVMLPSTVLAVRSIGMFIHCSISEASAGLHTCRCQWLCMR